MIELAQYRSNEGLWSNNFVSSTEIQNLNPYTWWKGICGSTYLNKIAVAILSLPPSSAATERSFSTFSLIHTKKRNRLTNERAAKLLYIHQNRNNLKKSSVPKKNPAKKFRYSLTQYVMTMTLINLTFLVHLKHQHPNK